MIKINLVYKLMGEIVFIAKHAILKILLKILSGLHQREAADQITVQCNLTEGPLA
jgi:hypothetical protein